MNKLIFQDWDRINYTEAYERQQKLFDTLLMEKKQEKESGQHYWIFCEHFPVLTLGKHGKPDNLLVSEAWLQEKGITFQVTDRGGDITYHGPGQQVCYPILDLGTLGMGLKQYIFLLEELIINVLKQYDIQGERFSGASGVWIAPHSSQARKICAIGVKSSRYVTMHGLALNVNTDLDAFSIINPCGFTDKGVTSLARECGKSIDMEAVKSAIRREAAKQFGQI